MLRPPFYYLVLGQLAEMLLTADRVIRFNFLMNQIVLFSIQPPHGHGGRKGWMQLASPSAFSDQLAVFSWMMVFSVSPAMQQPSAVLAKDHCIDV